MKSRKWVKIGPGIRKNVETGLIRRSPAAMRRLLIDKVREQKNICAWCHKEFTDVREITPDHIEPRGLGAARRQDSEDNIAAVHALCNQEKGSRRIA